MAVVASQITSHPWWRHQMETFSASLAIYAGNSPVLGEFPAQRLVARGFDFSLICVWINGWVNNSEAGGLRRYRAHYDVTVMIGGFPKSLFRLTSKETSEIRITGPLRFTTGGFPSQKASNAEHVSMWWRHLDQQPWCWLCRINGFLSTLRKDSNYQITMHQGHFIVDKWQKMQIDFSLLLKSIQRFRANLCYVWKRISVMMCKKSAYPNCSGRLITAPEDL